MKVVQINSVYGIGSTGGIAMNIQNYLKKSGIESRCIYGYGKGDYPDTYKMQKTLELKYNIARGRITGHHGFYNRHATRNAIDYMKMYDPDIIHLHNIHGYYINIEMLFEYIKQYQKKVIWTFHDCWPFTGHCSCFDMINCEKWKNGCKGCPGWNEDLILGRDRAWKNYEEKKRLFSKINDMTIVTPSSWLADNVRKSFLSEYPIKVIHNGIDTRLYRPIKDVALKEQLGGGKKKIVLGITPDLDGNKNGRDMVKLAELLGSDYMMVIVALKTREKLPSNVYVLPRIIEREKMARIYSLADVFVNPTLQDNFPTVNLESIACGTPVITYNTGGSPEGIIGKFGDVVPKHDVEQLAECVKKWTSVEYEVQWNKIDRSVLSKEVFAEQYIKLYNGE